MKKKLMGGLALRVFNDASEPTPGEIAKAIADVNKTFAEYRQKNDAAIAEARRGFADVVRQEELAKMDARMSEVQASLDEMNRRMAIAQTQADEDGFTAESRAYTKDVANYVRKGAVSATMAASVDSDPDGGYTVGEEVEAGISRVLGVDSVFRSLATVRSIGAPSYKRIRNAGGSGSGWVGEKDSRPATNTPTLLVQEFPTHEIYAQPIATQTLLDDSKVDIAAWLADEVGIEFADQEGDAFINGDGNNKPRGFIGGYTPVANGSFSASGSRLGYIATGVSGNFNGDSVSSPLTNPNDELIDLIYALDRRMRNGAQFLMADPTLARVRKFKDADGNYIWQPSTQLGEPATLLGYSVETDDNMPAIAANSFSIAFGNFSRGYLILDRFGVRVLRDPYTNKPYVQFYTTKRVGGGIQDFEAIKLLKFGTS